MLAQYRCHAYLAFETNTWHNSFLRQNKEVARLEYIPHGFSWKLLRVNFNCLGIVWSCYKKFHLGISKMMQFLSVERLRKLLVTYTISSLITTKFIILYNLRIILSMSQKSMKSLYAFLLKTAFRKRYLSNIWIATGHLKPFENADTADGACAFTSKISPQVSKGYHVVDLLIYIITRCLNISQSGKPVKKRRRQG